MRSFFYNSLISLCLLFSVSACTEEATVPEKKVERPIEYDEYGNEVIYTADGERELQDDGCD